MRHLYYEIDLRVCFIKSKKKKKKKKKWDSTEEPHLCMPTSYTYDSRPIFPFKSLRRKN